MYESGMKVSLYKTARHGWPQGTIGYVWGAGPRSMRGHWGVDSCLASRDHCPLSQKIRDNYQLLGQCWSSVAVAGPTLAQHWVNICFVWATPQVTREVDSTANMSQCCLMLGQLWIHWPNIKTTLGQCLCTLTQQWSNIVVMCDVRWDVSMMSCMTHGQIN